MTSKGSGSSSHSHTVKKQWYYNDTRNILEEKEASEKQKGMKASSGRMRFCCGLCPKRYPSQKKLRAHILARHPVEDKSLLVCPGCGRCYVHRNSLNAHRKLSQQCNEAYWKEKSIKFDTYVCNHCSKKYRNDAVFTLHLENNKICRKSFKNLKKYVTENAGNNPKDRKTDPHQKYLTSLGPSKRNLKDRIELISDNLKRNKALRNNPRLCCPGCNKIFFTRTQTTSHMKVCNYTKGRTGPQLQFLIPHSTGRHKYQCPGCRSKYTVFHELHRHFFRSKLCFKYWKPYIYRYKYKPPCNFSHKSEMVLHRKSSGSPQQSDLGVSPNDVHKCCNCNCHTGKSAHSSRNAEPDGSRIRKRTSENTNCKPEGENSHTKEVSANSEKRCKNEDGTISTHQPSFAKPHVTSSGNAGSGDKEGNQSCIQSTYTHRSFVDAFLSEPSNKSNKNDFIPPERRSKRIKSRSRNAVSASTLNGENEGKGKVDEVNSDTSNDEDEDDTESRQCEKCDRIFRSPFLLRLHDLDQHPKKTERLFSCSTCNRRYNQSASLYGHYTTSPKCRADFEKERFLHIRCDVCGQVCLNHISLANHHLKYHKKNGCDQRSDQKAMELIDESSRGSDEFIENSQTSSGSDCKSKEGLTQSDSDSDSDSDWRTGEKKKSPKPSCGSNCKSKEGLYQSDSGSESESESKSENESDSDSDSGSDSDWLPSMEKKLSKSTANSENKFTAKYCEPPEARLDEIGNFLQRIQSLKSKPREHVREKYICLKCKQCYASRYSLSRHHEKRRMCRKPDKEGRNYIVVFKNDAQSTHSGDSRDSRKCASQGAASIEEQSHLIKREPVDCLSDKTEASQEITYDGSSVPSTLDKSMVIYHSGCTRQQIKRRRKRGDTSIVRNHFCLSCGTSYTRGEHLVRHIANNADCEEQYLKMQKNGQIPIHRCDICTMNFVSAILLSRHKQTRHKNLVSGKENVDDPESEVTSDDMDRVPLSVRQQEQKKKKVSKRKRKNLNKPGKNDREQDVSENDHQEKHQYKCSHCEKQFSSEDRLSKHENKNCPSHSRSTKVGNEDSDSVLDNTFDTSTISKEDLPPPLVSGNPRNKKVEEGKTAGKLHHSASLDAKAVDESFSKESDLIDDFGFSLLDDQPELDYDAGICAAILNGKTEENLKADLCPGSEEMILPELTASARKKETTSYLSTDDTELYCESSQSMSDVDDTNNPKSQSHSSFTKVGNKDSNAEPQASVTYSDMSAVSKKALPAPLTTAGRTSKKAVEGKDVFKNQNSGGLNSKAVDDSVMESLSKESTSKEFDDFGFALLDDESELNYDPGSCGVKPDLNCEVNMEEDELCPGNVELMVPELTPSVMKSEDSDDTELYSQSSQCGESDTDVIAQVPPSEHPTFQSGMDGASGNQSKSELNDVFKASHFSTLRDIFRSVLKGKKEDTLLQSSQSATFPTGHNDELFSDPFDLDEVSACKTCGKIHQLFSNCIWSE